MKKNGAAMLMVFCLAAAPMVQAQEVTFTGEKCPLNIVGTPEEGEVRNEVLLDQVDLLGVVTGNEIVVRYTEEGKDVYALVSLEDVMTKIPTLNLSDLPAVIDWADLGTGASGDVVKTIQEALAAKGFLEEGGADGQYGSGTAAAVSAFQEQNGLSATGTVDLYTYFALMEKEAEPMTVAYPPVFNAEDKFASIYDHVEDPNILEAFKDPAWAFNYDLFEGRGEITHGTGVHLGTWSDESTQIDRLQMDVDLIIYVYADEEGVINLVPAFKVSSIGSYRPYVEGIAVKGENEVTNLSVLACDGQIEGTQLSEVAIVPLTGDEDLEEGTRALLRIKGASRDYELEFDVSADVAAVVDAY